MPSAYLDNLKRAVEAMHGCQCSHETSGLVHEMMDGKTVWRGMVETYALTGHPKATKAFAWGWEDDDDEIRYVAVLNVPPISSPREAVQAAIASKKQR
jgi:hypothetical protein